MNNEKIIKFFNILEEKYNDSVTNLSKTDNGNLFIKKDFIMISGDSIADTKQNDNLSSVDGIYLDYNNNNLVLYFFEFKKVDFFDKTYSNKFKLNECVDKMRKCPHNCKYIDCIKKPKKNLFDKKLSLLKTKPLEMLILLYNIIEEYSDIDGEELFNIEKRYILVSETKKIFENTNTKNKNNARRKGRTKEIFSFLDKISPYPFKYSKCVNEEFFLNMLEEFKKN